MGGEGLRAERAFGWKGLTGGEGLLAAKAKGRKKKGEGNEGGTYRVTRTRGRSAGTFGRPTGGGKTSARNKR